MQTSRAWNTQVVGGGGGGEAGIQQTLEHTRQTSPNNIYVMGLHGDVFPSWD